MTSNQRYITGSTMMYRDIKHEVGHITMYKVSVNSTNRMIADHYPLVEYTVCVKKVSSFKHFIYIRQSSAFLFCNPRAPFLRAQFQNCLPLPCGQAGYLAGNLAVHPAGVVAMADSHLYLR